MKINAFIIALLAATVASASSIAAVAPSLSLTVGGQQNAYGSERDIDDKVTAFGAAEFRFTDYWASEYWFSAGDTDDSGGASVDVKRWHLSALYYLPAVARIQPYLAVGGGQLQSDRNSTQDKTDQEVNVGVGVRFQLSDAVGLRGDVRYLHGRDDDSGNLTAALGLYYSFGGAKLETVAAAPVTATAAPVPAAPVTAAPVPAAPAPAAPVAVAPESTLKDADGDGVENSRDKCPNTPAAARVDTLGCEIEVSQVAAVKLQVKFAFDSDRVEEHYFTDIRGLADFLKQNEAMYVEVGGHTDSIGSDDYNQNLSQRRAFAVMEVLQNEHGIARRRLKAVGYGESQPVASNETDAGRAENRRAVAVLEVEYTNE